MRNEREPREDSRERTNGVIDQGESLGPISEVSLENTVDTESKRLEHKVGVFAATLAESPGKKKSFMDRLREWSSWRSVMALLVGLHLNAGRQYEMPENKPATASSADHETYKEGMKELFEIEIPVSAEKTLNFSADSDKGLQEYAPHYEATKTASVEKEVEQLKEFIQKNAFKKYKVRIQGSSSFEGEMAKNETLSAQRANIAFAEILSQLEKSGIDTQNIDWEVSGAGEHIEIDGKQVSETEAYQYLQKELGVHSKKEVDKKIEAFNDKKFSHPALEKLLTQMRGHQVSIEGIGELPVESTETIIFELEYPPEEDSSVSPSVDSFSSDFHDAILRLRREDELDGTKPEIGTLGPQKKPKPPLPGRTPRPLPENSPVDPPKDPPKFPTPPRTPVPPRPPRVFPEPGPKTPTSPEPLPPTPEPIPPTPEPWPPEPPPPPPEFFEITRAPQGKRKEIQSMRVHRMDKEDRDERFYKKQPLHGSKSRTGREAVVIDTSGNAELLPKMIHDEKDLSRGFAKKDRSNEARRDSIDRRKKRDLLGRNETSE